MVAKPRANFQKIKRYISPRKSRLDVLKSASRRNRCECAAEKSATQVDPNLFLEIGFAKKLEIAPQSHRSSRTRPSRFRTRGRGRFPQRGAPGADSCGKSISVHKLRIFFTALVPRNNGRALPFRRRSARAWIELYEKLLLKRTSRIRALRGALARVRHALYQ